MMQGFKTLFRGALSRPQLLAAAVFLFGFLISFVPQLLAPGFATPDDPYYHAAHSRAYWSGERFEYPAFTTFADRPADLWLLYHALMSPFTVGFGGSDFEALAFGSKLFNSLLSGLFLFMIFALARSFARRTAPDPSSGRSDAVALSIAGLVAVAISLFASSEFALRMFLFSRPHILMATIVLAAAWCILERKRYLLFCVAALAPLSYSFSALVFLPSLGAVGAWVLLGRDRRMLRSAFEPFLVTLAGVALGVLLHPEPANYLYNAWYVTFQAVIASVTTSLFSFMPAFKGVSIPGELTGSEHFAPAFLLLTPVLVARLAYLATRKNGPDDRRLAEGSFLAVAIAMLVLQILIRRSVEYAVPFAAVPLSSLVCIHGAPWLRDRRAALEARQGEIGDAYRRIAGNLREVARHRFVRAAFALLFVSIFVVRPAIAGISLVRSSRDSFDGYRAAAAYLSEHSQGGIVLNPEFSMYARLVFFAPGVRFANGMDARFMLARDPRLGWQVEHFLRNEPPCGGKSCGAPGMAAYDAFKAAGVEFVVIDTDLHFGLPTRSAVESDPRFTEVFRDPAHPNVSVYAL